jgi:hypothetical protein
VKSTPLQEAIAALDRRLDAGELVTEADVLALVAVPRDGHVRYEISRLLGRVHAAERKR